MKKGLIASLLAFFVLSSCNSGSEKVVVKPHCEAIDSLIPQFSKGFKIIYYKGFKDVQFLNTQNGSVLQSYIIMPEGKALPIGFEKSVVVKDRLQKVVCGSSTFISCLELIEEGAAIGGVTEAPYICSKYIQQRIKEGSVVNLGGDGFFDYEKLLALQPDVFFKSSYQIKERSSEKITVPVVYNAEFSENNPLARAEWMVYVAAFFDKEELADSVFKDCVLKYNEVKERLNNAKTKPSVFFNIPWEDVWYMPSKETFLATLVQDAGADYIWRDASKTNSLNISLSFEEVLQKASKADFWLHPNSLNDLKSIVSLDRKYELFDALKNKKVYNNNKVTTLAGGNNFWEHGVLNPHVLLNDLGIIFHPELFTTSDTLVYYKQLP